MYAHFDISGRVAVLVHLESFQSREYEGSFVFLYLTVCVLRVYWASGGVRGGVVVKALRYKRVSGSIPDGVIGIFQWHNPSGRTMALGSTQPLTGKSTRNISWEVKGAGA